MKLHKHLSLILVLILTLTLLPGCGGSAKTESAVMQSPGAAPMEEYAMAVRHGQIADDCSS